MTYIINPAVFYWMNVLNALGSLCTVFMVIFGIAAVVLAIVLFDCEGYLERETEAAIKKWIKRLVVSFFILTLFVVFIPRKDTMMEMLVARFATYENTEWTIDSIKNIVDYIVQAMQSLK